jgi:hypothetical protein
MCIDRVLRSSCEAQARGPPCVHQSTGDLAAGGWAGREAAARSQWAPLRPLGLTTLAEDQAVRGAPSSLSAVPLNRTHH